jgi:hypothetical protein
VTMRRAVPYLVAALLGVGAALLAACGSSTSGGVPAGDAAVLKGQLEDVRQRVADGQCDGLSSQLRDVDSAIDGLPQSVDARLVSALRRGSDRLQGTAVSDCNASRLKAQAKTTTTPTLTDTAPTQTDTTTVPTDTTTTPTATTPPATTPPDTTTLVPEPPPAPEPPPTPEPAPVPPPPVVGPGGGTPPRIP